MTMSLLFTIILLLLSDSLLTAWPCLFCFQLFRCCFNSFSHMVLELSITIVVYPKLMSNLFLNINLMKDVYVEKIDSFFLFDCNDVLLPAVSMSSPKMA